jgi:hypothetical protein
MLASYASGTLNKLKRAADLFSGMEKQGVHAIAQANENIIDVEIRLDATGLGLDTRNASSRGSTSPRSNNGPMVSNSCSGRRSCSPTRSFAPLDPRSQRSSGRSKNTNSSWKHDKPKCSLRTAGSPRISSELRQMSGERSAKSDLLFARSRSGVELRMSISGQRRPGYFWLRRQTRKRKAASGTNTLRN